MFEMSLKVELFKRQTSKMPAGWLDQPQDNEADACGLPEVSAEGGHWRPRRSHASFYHEEVRRSITFFQDVTDSWTTDNQARPKQGSK